MYQRHFHILNIKLDIFLYCIFILNESRWRIIKYRSNYYYNREQIDRAFSKEKFHPIRSMKSQRDWKFGESEKKKEGRRGNRGVSIDRVIPIDRSINREILHERNEGEKRKSKECFAYSIKRREYPQTLATWRVCTTARAITRATITTCTHSRSCQISARVATRPITSLFEREGKGRVYYFYLG